MSENASPRDSPPPGGSTSHSLLEQARGADPLAWRRLVSLYAPLVAYWLRRWGVAEQDIVDVAQEVFSAVAGHLGRFRKQAPGDTFRGWLSTIAKNKVRDYYRRRLHEPAAAGGTEAWMRLQEVAADEPCGVGDSADDVGFRHVLLRALEAIKGEFHENTWRAFWGVVIEGRAAADVATDLGMRPGTVRVAKSRVLLRLRRELGDLAELNDPPSTT
jgi:RNA polymerase sigma-70 factor (ECF subfamily)